MGEEFRPSLLRSLITANKRRGSDPKTVPQCYSTPHRPSLTLDLLMAGHRIYSIKRSNVFFFLAHSRAAFIRGRCLLRNYISQITANNRPFARWRHFTTTTRIFQGIAFAFLCKLRLLFLNLTATTKCKYEKNNETNSGHSSKRRHRANGPLR